MLDVSTGLSSKLEWRADPASGGPSGRHDINDERLMDNPMPIPSVLVVKKASKRRSHASSSPMPDRHLIRTWPTRPLALTAIVATHPDRTHGLMPHHQFRITCAMYASPILWQVAAQSVRIETQASAACSLQSHGSLDDSLIPTTYS